MKTLAQFTHKSTMHVIRLVYTIRLFLAHLKHKIKTFFRLILRMKHYTITVHRFICSHSILPAEFFFLGSIVLSFLFCFFGKFSKVTKIREQCQKQEETIREQEGELESKKNELQKLKDEEASLEKEYNEDQRNLDKLTRTLQDTQLQISQIKALVTQLEENQRQISDALEACKAAIENNDPNSVSYYTLKIEPDFREAKTALEDRKVISQT